MKHFLPFLAFFAFLGIVSAQAPQGINFQGVARNADTSPKPAGTSIQIEFKIWDAPNLGNLLYNEKQTQTTNGVGLFTCIIGNGNIQPGSGSFSNIPWATGQKYLEVFVDNQSSARQLMVSVPYALYAASGVGTPGLDGVGIISTVNNGNGTYTFNYSNGTSFTTSSLNGTPGTNGTNGTNGANGVGIVSTVNNGNGTYTFNYSNGTSFTTSNLNGTPGTNGTNGTNGANGVGIVSTVNNGNGTYTFNYSNGTSFTTSNLNGTPGTNGTNGMNGMNGTNGANGVGIVSTVNNGNGTYTFTYSNGTSFTTSNLTGPVGPAATFDLAIFEERRPWNANLPAPTSNDSWYKRLLNTTVKSSPTNAVSLSNNNIIFNQPGIYLITASAPAHNVNRHRLCLRNQSNSAIVIFGTSEFVGANQTRSYINGVISILSSGEQYFLDHHLLVPDGNAQSVGVETHLGPPFNTPQDFETYSQISIQKL